MTFRLPAVTVAALATLLSTAVLTACDDTDDPRPDPDSRRGIDARAYYRDYESAMDYDSGGVVQYSMPSGDAAESESGATDGRQWQPPRPNEDNYFHDHGTSGFVPTASDARSTFALDVDTGSYGVACNLLNQGYRVPRSAIRSRSGSTPSTTTTPPRSTPTSG